MALCVVVGAGTFRACRELQATRVRAPEGAFECSPATCCVEACVLMPWGAWRGGGDRRRGERRSEVTTECVVLGDYLQRMARRSRDVAGAMSVEIVGAACLAVIFPITIRSLGPELYGKYTVLYLIFGLIGLWVYAGPTASVIQLILQLEHDDEQVMQRCRRQLIVVWAPSSVLGTAIAVALVGQSLLVPAALVIGLDLLLAGLASLNFSNVFAIDGVTAAAKLRMVQPILRVLGVVGLAAAGTVSILSLVGVNIVVSGIMLLLSSAVIRRRQRPDWLGTRWLGRRELVRYSVYYSASMSTNAVQNEGEKFALATYRPAAEVGEYAAAYRVVQTSLLPMSALMAAASRWFMVKDDRVGAQRLRTQRLSVVVAAYGIVVAAAILMGADIIQWVAGSEYTEVSTIAVWLMFFPLLHGLADLPPMGLLGLGRNRERMLMGFGTSVAAIVCYLALVPHFGWRGAVIGTYVSEVVSIAAGWVLLVRYQHVADLARSDERGANEEPVPSEPGFSE